jgi:hypothetical protein
VDIRRILLQAEVHNTVGHCFHIQLAVRTVVQSRAVHRDLSLAGHSNALLPALDPQIGIAVVAAAHTRTLAPRMDSRLVVDMALSFVLRRISSLVVVLECISEDSLGKRKDDRKVVTMDNMMAEMSEHSTERAWEES